MKIYITHHENSQVGIQMEKNELHMHYLLFLGTLKHSIHYLKVTPNSKTHSFFLWDGLPAKATVWDTSYPVCVPIPNEEESYSWRLFGERTSEHGPDVRLFACTW